MPQLFEPANDSPLQHRRTPRATRIALTAVVFAYIALGAVSNFLISFGYVRTSGGELSSDRATFITVNALTLTGFQHDVGLDLSAVALPGAPLLLICLIVAGSVLAQFGQAALAVRIVGLPYTLGRIFLASCAVTALGTLAGAVALADRGLLQSLLGGASAFANCGLFYGHTPALTHWQATAVLMPLSAAGGMGLLVWMDLFDRAIGATPRISRHTRVVLAALAVVYLLGFVALVLAQAAQQPTYSWRFRIAAASVEAVNTRTAGFWLEYLSVFRRRAVWIMALLMIIGAAPLSTAGGLKVTTFWRVWRGLIAAWKGNPPGRGFVIACTWILAYAAAVFTGFWLLLGTEPQMSPDHVLFASISAVGNVGLAHNPISTVDRGLWILCGLMLFGRFAPFAVLWWLTREGDDEDVAFA